MKSIENSIEGEQLLPNSLLSEELKKGMAGCGLVSPDNKTSNGECSTDFKLIHSFEVVKDILTINKTVIMASGSEYLDVSDDDFELVVEASSDECISPVKKVDEDAISAPQIVEEIKNILGIQNGSVEIEEELEENVLPNVDSEADDTAKNNCVQSQDKIINVSNSSINNDPVKDTRCTKENESQEKNISKTLVECNSLVDSNIKSETSNNNVVLETRCDSSQEKSIGPSTGTKSNPLCRNVQETDEEQVSTSNGNTENSDDNLPPSRLSNSSECSEHLPMSQSSNVSESSVEWTVVDFVETSDDDLSDHGKMNTNLKEVGSKPEYQPNHEGSLKRAACDYDANEKLKKPKLDVNASNLLEGYTLKRSLSIASSEETNETKRAKSTAEIDEENSDFKSSKDCTVQNISMNDNDSCDINQETPGDEKIELKRKESSQSQLICTENSLEKHDGFKAVVLLQDTDMMRSNDEDQTTSEFINEELSSNLNKKSHGETLTLKVKNLESKEQVTIFDKTSFDISYVKDNAPASKGPEKQDSDSADIEAIKKQEILNLDKESKKCDTPFQGLNESEKNVLQNDNSVSCHQVSTTSDESMRANQILEPEQTDIRFDAQAQNSDQLLVIKDDISKEPGGNDVEVIEDKKISENTTIGNETYLETVNIESVNTHEISEISKENKNIGNNTQDLNDIEDQQLISKVGDDMAGIVSNEIILPNERSDIDEEKSRSISFQVIDQGQTPNGKAKGDQSVSNFNMSVNQDYNGDREVLIVNEKKVIRSEDDLRIEGTSKVDQEDHKIVFAERSQSEQMPDNRPDYALLELINRTEKSGNTGKGCAMTSEVAKSAHFVDGTCSENSNGPIVSVKNYKNKEDSCMKPSPILNEDKDPSQLNGKDAISVIEVSTTNLINQEPSVDDLDKTDKAGSSVRLSSSFNDKEISGSDQEEKSSKFTHVGLEVHEEQFLRKSTVVNDIVDEKKYNKSKEPCDNEAGLHFNAFEDEIKDESKDDDVHDHYLSREIQNLAGKFERQQDNSSVTKNMSSPFRILKKALNKKLQAKSLSNLDLAIERVVENSRRKTENSVPILTKFHKDKLRKMTRVDLEEAVVLKVCEAISDRSELGQLRLRVQNLEQNNELWRKKAVQFEKQNRELEMVLKRFMSESAQFRRDRQINEPPQPIKVTRSVGLQVVLACSINSSALSTSKSKFSSDSIKNENKSSSSTSRLQSNQQNQRHPQVLLPKRLEKEPVKDTVKKVPFSPPLRSNSSLSSPASSKDREPAKKAKRNIASSNVGSSAVSSRTSTTKANLQANSLSAPIAHQPSSPKLQNIAPKPPSSVTPQKVKQAGNKHMEVIDLTDREEKNKGLPQTQTSGPSIRVAPSTQVCFLQPSPGSAPAQPMYALVQKPGRQQFLVATSSASSPLSGLQSQPVMSMTPRPTNTITALPVFRAGGGQLIPVQTTPVSKPNNPGNKAVQQQVAQAVRMASQIKVMRHPAPLPNVPQPVVRIGNKAPPPKPTLKIAKTINGIMLSWSMTLSKDLADMASYQLYAYQEASLPPSTSLWKKVGDVKALPLPMACTLTQFIDGHKYHFAVRAVDVHGRIGPFSHPGSILLTK